MTGSSPTFGDDPVDFTIAQGMSRAAQINTLQHYFQQLDRGVIETDRQELNSTLPADSHLSKQDAEILFTGLSMNGAATQSRSAASFADYTFNIDSERAAEVLDYQSVARIALEDAGALDKDGTADTVTLTGTFPPDMNEDELSDVRSLSGDIRRLFFDAETIVRIANPYFDSSPSVVGDIAGLVNRGVTTKILTRETESAGDNLKSALNSIHAAIDDTNRRNLQIRDLYKFDSQTGTQSYATHAKIAIADREVCYLGSANLTQTSLKSNFELGVLVRGKMVGTAIGVFDTVFDHASRVSLPL
jgi:cardiolipin synthase/putative cardiolipin synthase